MWLMVIFCRILFGEDVGAPWGGLCGGSTKSVQQSMSADFLKGYCQVPLLKGAQEVAIFIIPSGLFL